MYRYGFARSSKEDRYKWSQTVKTFLKNGSHTILRRVYILVDSRHPIKESDVEMMNVLNECELSSVCSGRYRCPPLAEYFTKNAS